MNREDEFQLKMSMLALMGMLTGKVNPKTLALDLLRETMELISDIEYFIQESKSSEMAKLPVLAIIQMLRDETEKSLKLEEAKHKC